jgi:hypothetical protein
MRRGIMKMKILDSKEFTTPACAGEVEAAIALIEKYAKLYGYKVSVRILDTAVTRTKKAPVKTELETLVRVGAGIWERWEYRFLFAKRQYFWKGEEIHLTAGEALYVYRWVVRSEQSPKQRYYLRHIRHKFGAEFLAEVSDVQS